MTFALHVDGPRWRAHTAGVLAGTPGLVPVIKGNGYGYGKALLAAEAGRLGVATVAVGEPGEVADVRGGFDGDVLVMRPYLAGVDTEPGDPVERVVRTVDSTVGLQALAGHRLVVEVATSMRRFGFAAAALPELAGQLSAGTRLEGIAVHLPLPRGRRSGAEGPGVAETQRIVAGAQAAGIRFGAVWVSHLTPAEIAELAGRFPDLTFRARIGTRLWLGDR